MVWRLLLRDVVQRAAKQAVSDQFSRAAAQQADASGSPQAPLEPCHVGFVFALGIESGGTEDLVQDARHTKAEGFRIVEGLLGGRHVAIVTTGVGQAAARRGATTLIGGLRPKWIVSAGLAGGL